MRPGDPIARAGAAFWAYGYSTQFKLARRRGDAESKTGSGFLRDPITIGRKICSHWWKFHRLMLGECRSD